MSKTYSLYAKMPGEPLKGYINGEMLNNPNKRPKCLISESDIRELDDITRHYESEEDFKNNYLEEFYGEKILLEKIILIKDEVTEEKKKSIYIEPVFREDSLNINDVECLHKAVEGILKNNPNELINFRPLLRISEKIIKNNPGMGIIPLIERTLSTYFEKDRYEDNREMYFMLK